MPESDKHTSLPQPQNSINVYSKMFCGIGPKSKKVCLDATAIIILEENTKTSFEHLTLDPKLRIV
jgi:hypothetical protein